jgi:hypothetical protein
MLVLLCLPPLCCMAPGRMCILAAYSTVPPLNSKTNGRLFVMAGTADSSP